MPAPGKLLAAVPSPQSTVKDESVVLPPGAASVIVATYCWLTVAVVPSVALSTGATTTASAVKFKPTSTGSWSDARYGVGAKRSSVVKFRL